jgi:hypothetical protein
MWAYDWKIEGLFLRNCLWPKRKCLFLAELLMSKTEVLVACGTANFHNGSACSLRNCLCPERKCLVLAELPMSEMEVLVPWGTAYVRNGSTCSLKNCLCPVSKRFPFIKSNYRRKIHKNIIFSKRKCLYPAVLISSISKDVKTHLWIEIVSIKKFHQKVVWWKKFEITVNFDHDVTNKHTNKQTNKQMF